ncbi:hypothetical protein D3C72_1270870 [compost metagenome]
MHGVGRRDRAGGLRLAGAQAEERRHLGGGGRSVVHEQAQALGLRGRQPERALAAPLGVEKTRLALQVFAPADLQAPGLEVAERAAHDHAQRAGVGHLAAQIGQPHDAAAAAVGMGVLHAHQQPQRLEGRAPSVDGLRRGEFDGKKGRGGGGGHAPD